MGFEAKAEVYADLRPRGYRMRYGPRNGIVARIAYVKSGEVKPHAKFEVEVSVERIRCSAPNPSRTWTSAKATKFGWSTRRTTRSPPRSKSTVRIDDRHTSSLYPFYATRLPVYYEQLCTILPVLNSGPEHGGGTKGAISGDLLPCA